MITFRNLAITISSAVFFAPLLSAGDLSSYRDFQLGMNLQEAGKQAKMKTSEAKMIHQRPAVIQDLDYGRALMDHLGLGRFHLRLLSCLLQVHSKLKVAIAGKISGG